MITTTAAEIGRVRPGDILFVIPVHSCLTVDLWKEYVCLDGTKVPTIRSCDL